MIWSIDGEPLYGMDQGSGDSLHNKWSSQIDFTPSSRQILDSLRSSLYNNQLKDENATTAETTLTPGSNEPYELGGTADPTKPQIAPPQ